LEVVTQQVESLEEVSLEEASLEDVSSEVASLEKVSLEVATQEAESQEEVDLGRVIHSEYCGMARSILRTAKGADTFVVFLWAICILQNLSQLVDQEETLFKSKRLKKLPGGGGD
jgi:hypothetical protein